MSLKTLEVCHLLSLCPNYFQEFCSKAGGVWKIMCSANFKRAFGKDIQPSKRAEENNSFLLHSHICYISSWIIHFYKQITTFHTYDKRLVKRCFTLLKKHSNGQGGPPVISAM